MLWKHYEGGQHVGRAREKYNEKRGKHEYCLREYINVGKETKENVNETGWQLGTVSNGYGDV